jgi:hypothetical protein
LADRVTSNSGVGGVRDASSMTANSARNGSAAATSDLDGLRDDDTGRYELGTHTARYLLDLDARRLLRIPRTAVTGTHGNPAPAGTVVFLFDLDGDWADVVELEHCAVGEEMRLRAVIDGQIQPWRTTAVLHIDRVPTPAPRKSTVAPDDEE